MSINNIYFIGRQALLANQASAQRVSHNIANASTEGYTRQRTSHVTTPSVMTSHGHVASGVVIDGVIRTRDQFLYASFRRESGIRERFNAVSGGLSQIEAILGEMTEAGVSNSLEVFFDAWKSMAEHPESETQRNLVRTYGERVAEQFNNLAAKIEVFTQSTRDVALSQVSEVNTKLKAIAALNSRIVSAEAGGKTAPDLRDQRDLLLDELSQLVDMTARENNAGAVEVLIGGHVVVDAMSAHPVHLVQGADGRYDIAYEDSTQGFGLKGGRLGGSLEILEKHIPAALSRIDSLVASFVESVNDLHVQGTNASGVTGINFFDPAGVTASSIRLSDEVAASSLNVMKGVSGEESDVDLALQIAQLRYEPRAALGGQTLLSAYADVAVYVGDQIQGARDAAIAQDTVIATLENQRSSVSDVSTDEELVNLLQYQQAYAAAVKVLDSANQMFDTLIAIA